MKKRHGRRFLALLVAAMMAVSLISVTAFADDEDEHTPDDEEIVEEVDTDTEDTEDAEDEADIEDANPDDVEGTGDDDSEDADTEDADPDDEDVDDDAENGETIASLTLGVETTVTIDEEGGSVYLSFTPEESGVYCFASIGVPETSTHGNLYNADGELVASGDSKRDGIIDYHDDSNFAVYCFCEAGVAYTLEVEGERYYGDETGFVNIFDVMVENWGEEWPTICVGSTPVVSLSDPYPVLTARALNYQGEELSLDDEGYTFCWYTYEDGSDAPVILGTDKTLTVTDLQYKEHKYFCEICYKNLATVVNSYTIVVLDYKFYSKYEIPYYAALGSELTLVPVFYDNDWNTVEDLSGFTFKWAKYREYYDEESMSYLFESEELGTTEGEGYTISSVSENDYYSTDDYETSWYYECDIYKDGVFVTYCMFTIWYVEPDEVVDTGVTDDTAAAGDVGTTDVTDGTSGGSTAKGSATGGSESAGSAAPQTADTSAPMLYLVLMLAAGAALVVVLLGRRRADRA